MNDQNLLNYYLSLREREAYQWNLSPRSLYLELETRDFFRRHIQPTSSINACNVGIGVGEWDDFLGYVLQGKGQLTSIDIDAEICELFRYRQRREGHTNPSEVICADILTYPIPPNSFHLFTMIGSTLTEIGNPKQALYKAHEALAEDGFLFVMNFERNITKNECVFILEQLSFSIEAVEAFSRYPNTEFYCIAARKWNTST